MACGKSIYSPVIIIIIIFDTKNAKFKNKELSREKILNMKVTATVID